MIYNYSKSVPGVYVDVLDISPRWRSLHDVAMLKRIFGGGAQLFRDIFYLFIRLVFRRPSVVHLTTPGGLALFRDLAVALLSRAFGVPVVYHIRFGGVPLLLARPKTLLGKLIRVVFSCANNIILIDLSTYKAVKAAGFINAAHVPNCYDSRLMPGREELKRQVVYIGWVIPAKGIGELMDAWSSLGVNEWTLKIVGPVSPEYELDLRRRLPANDMAVDFLGGRTHQEAMKVLASSEILILPSYTEGFPNVVLEGMAMGCAVVGTSVGAIPEMLAEGAGEVIPAKNVDAIVSVLGRLMESAEHRRTLGECARRRAEERYSLEAVFERYLNIWKSLV